MTIRRQPGRGHRHPLCQRSAHCCTTVARVGFGRRSIRL